MAGSSSDVVESLPNERLGSGPHRACLLLCSWQRDFVFSVPGEVNRPRCLVSTGNSRIFLLGHVLLFSRLATTSHGEKDFPEVLIVPFPKAPEEQKKYYVEKTRR